MKRLWLIGEFLTNKKKARLEAFYELSWAVGVGTLPFWLGGFVLLATGGDPQVDSSSGYFYRWWKLSQLSWYKGELLIFAVSLVAPAIWFAVNDPPAGKPMPHRRPLTAIVSVVGLLAAVLYGLVQAKVVSDTQLVYDSSVYFAAVATAALYLALAYHIFRLPEVPSVNEGMLVDDQVNFLREIEDRGGAHG